ncbi:hypothetical protein D3C78_611560 [compost metagenome]
MKVIKPFAAITKVFATMPTGQAIQGRITQALLGVTQAILGHQTLCLETTGFLVRLEMALSCPVGTTPLWNEMWSQTTVTAI